MKYQEIEVPGLPQTIFIVPDALTGKALLSEGIARGRIWTNKEVLDLKAKEPGVDDARKIAEAKMMFDGRVEDPPPQKSLFEPTKRRKD